ncbi:MAG: glucosamine-6-phosphate deaminase [Clostridiales bacterium]|nr:glucosamine-6-phosphate deaminase [Clostridiales bacterium]
MNIRIFENSEQVGAVAAQIFATQILENPHSVLGLATGSSPLETYQEIIHLYQKGLIDFSNITTFNLDEYVSIPHDHPASYHAFMNEHLFNHINIQKEKTYIPDGNVTDLQQESLHYDQKIRLAGGIDLQLLGIGNNAHIGFNEPSSLFTYGCHVVDLTQSTIEANTRFFDNEKQVPRQAISLGIGSIMNAKKIVLIALGKGKAQAIYNTVHGEIDPQVPASILRVHQHVTLLLDKEAAHLL